MPNDATAAFGETAAFGKTTPFGATAVNHAATMRVSG
jgi:hypothetical protein